MAFIFAAISMEKKGAEYCEFLAQNKISVSFEWVKKGCPRDYPSAYKQEKWERLIIQEKNRYSRQMRSIEQASPGQVAN